MDRERSGARQRLLIHRAISRRWLVSTWRRLVRDVRSAPDGLAVFGFALGLRLILSLLLSDTFDKDEFVYLALGRDVAHGAVPYRDFAFFHPPGILFLTALLNPLTEIWWPLARLFDVLVDSVTALLVWRIGTYLYDRRTALAAGVLYAVNPIVLVSAVRVDQEAIMTLLCVSGLTLLLGKQSSRWAIVAGACLGTAFWIKYPMLIFLPVYLLAARRRAIACLLGFVGVGGMLFLPYLDNIRRLYDETVVWQLVQRYHTPIVSRLETSVICWLALNPFAVAAVARRNIKPLWLVSGFASGGIFIFTASAYPHYFVTVAPFGALLGAPVASRFVRLGRRAVVLGSMAIAVILAGCLNLVTAQTFIPASHFSAIHPIVQLIDRTSPPGTPILGNRFEFAYLAGRPWVAHYFWDTRTTVTAQGLDRALRPQSTVVLYPSTSPFSFPAGLKSYLDSRYAESQRAGAILWLPRAGLAKRDTEDDSRLARDKPMTRVGLTKAL
ncbi:MAG TPA: glycosyltransferase family 39 protein [Chloroflexota bacterium]